MVYKTQNNVETVPLTRERSKKKGSKDVFIRNQEWEVIKDFPVKRIGEKQIEKAIHGVFNTRKKEMFKEGAKVKKKLQERRTRSKRRRNREAEVGKGMKEWDREPVLGLV